ncbi:MAG: carbon starvation protein A [Candidatus Margulisbacteria bacterium]|jgi:carbon starvation protein|nr:carbon starvation protein A [Candidatus Margulisiibacteriota bacterium]
MITALFLICVLALWLGYKHYGGFLDRFFRINPRAKTPAAAKRDNIDFVPAPAPVLLGHHFSSIAGAGPVVGPITAALAFGWLPALLWILAGGIFIGGAHDYAALLISVRHQGRSIAEIARQYLNRKTCRVFLVFIWLTLVYVLTVFFDMTASTFITEGSVASSSLFFILLAVVFGLLVNIGKISYWKTSLIFVPLLFGAVALGMRFPAVLPALGALSGQQAWLLILLVYCFLASTLPVWALLQPRDYLCSFLLYGSIAVSLAGILFGGLSGRLPVFFSYPAFTGLNSGEGFIFPFLFVVIACGAVSGFHSIVSSGTTAKQIASEKDIRPIGYGAMLIESVVGVISLITVLLLTRNAALSLNNPLLIYGQGLGQFAGIIGLPVKTGYVFGLLAVSTFLLTTLDTCTRLSRYIFEEFCGKFKHSVFLGTLCSLGLPALFLFIKITDAAGNIIPPWKAVWPIFGAANQLLAALTLLVAAVWLKKLRKSCWFIKLPLYFMLIVTLTALILLIWKFQLSLIGLVGLALLALAVYMLFESRGALV